MNDSGLRIAFFGSSLLSSHWNGAATYYRGLVRALHERGHRIRFFEPDAFDRQRHRDLDPDLPWVDARVYEGTEAGARRALREAREADVIVKASGVGVCDALLEREAPGLASASRRVCYWDVDAPATLARLASDPDDPLRDLVPAYDLVLVYGGGDPVRRGYFALGARDCVTVYNALDPTTHYPVAPDPAFEARLSFLGNRLPDREARVEEFLFEPARRHPEHRFLVGGCGWEPGVLPPNLRWLGHVPSRRHNAFNASARLVLNVHRDSMAHVGHSPATRVFEAAGAAACIVTDEVNGIQRFLAPGREILVARSGDEVSELLGTDAERARDIGRRARRRVLSEHTYRHRAMHVEHHLQALFDRAATTPHRDGMAREAATESDAAPPRGTAAARGTGAP